METAEFVEVGSKLDRGNVSGCPELDSEQFDE